MSVTVVCVPVKISRAMYPDHAVFVFHLVSTRVVFHLGCAKSREIGENLETFPRFSNAGRIERETNRTTWLASRVARERNREIEYVFGERRREEGENARGSVHSVSSVVRAKITRSDGTGDFDTSRGKTSH